MTVITAKRTNSVNSEDMENLKKAMFVQYQNEDTSGGIADAMGRFLAKLDKHGEGIERAFTKPSKKVVFLSRDYKVDAAY